MKKDEFEAAKILGKMDLKTNDKVNEPDADPKTEPQKSDKADSTDGAVSSTETIQKTEPSGIQRQESMTDLLQRYAGQDRADIEAWEKESQASMPAPSLPAARPTVKEMVDEVKRLIVEFVGKGLEAIGAYLLVNVFDGNFKKALSKDPYKGTSLNDLARHKEMPLSRQRLAECIRSAGVGAELESLGLNLDRLTFYHKVEISKLKSPEIRVQFAKEAHDKELTVSEVRDRVKKLTGKSISSDKRIVKSLIKQLGDVARLAADDDTRELLQDKDRLKEVLDKGDTALLLNSSEMFRKASAESGEVLRQMERTLEDIVLERRQDQEDGPDKANA